VIKIDSRRHWSRRLALAALLILSAATGPVAEAGGARLWTSESGLYRVGYMSQLDPITINEIHSWTLHVETADGTPVANADIEIRGGMPAHNHGLPTLPEVTEYLGKGDYRVEGMRFHMRGEWEIYVTISAAPGRDVCRIPLTL
jgi:hypothetical protein